MANFELSKKVKASMKSFQGKVYRAKMIKQRLKKYAAVGPPTVRFDCMHS